jgi:hypothetical protein
MDETKRIKAAVSFPNVQLTAEQELELKKALKSAVVTVLPKLKEGQVSVEYKENEATEK